MFYSNNIIKNYYLRLEVQESFEKIKYELNQLTKSRYIFSPTCVDVLFSVKVCKKYEELNTNIKSKSTAYDSNIKKLEAFMFPEDDQRQIEKVGCSSLWL